ncbi:MAG: CHAP domain-containing protein [Bacteroidales bacterium]|nr:CHAP domain-containing protein [Bacteroidales bacterium]
MRKSSPLRIVLLVVLLGILLAGGAWVWWMKSSQASNRWNASCVGDIPAPIGYKRVAAQAGDYTTFLRALPLKPKGSKVQLYTGGDANYQWLSTAVVDMPLLSNAEQCADVTMRLRAEYLYKTGRYGEICFTDVNYQKLQYQDGKNREAFEQYLKKVYGVCNTFSLYHETEPRAIHEVQPGDVLVYPARDGRQYGHALIVVDVAKNRAGKIAVMCAEGNTPAREIHILRNAAHPIRNPWFLLDGDERNIRVSVFHFEPEELRHY